MNVFIKYLLPSKIPISIKQERPINVFPVKFAFIKISKPYETLTTRHNKSIEIFHKASLRKTG